MVSYIFVADLLFRQSDVCKHLLPDPSKLSLTLTFDVNRPLMSVHTERLPHCHCNKCYVDRQNGYATHSSRHSVRQQKIKGAMVTIMESFDVNRPLVLKRKIYGTCHNAGVFVISFNKSFFFNF